MEVEISVDLTDERVHTFQEQGFLNLGRITTDKEIEWLRGVYDEIVKHYRGHIPDELVNAADGHAPALVTIVSPEHVVPELKNTIFFRNARKAMARLFDVKKTGIISGWRLFFKPPHRGKTPWHQDAAYRPPPHHGGTVWMPLDPATLESSCMHYLGGSHRGGLRPHSFHFDHLVTEDADDAQAVACPLSPGEATAHHCMTLHYASPNKTDRPRRALAVVFQVIGGGQNL